MLPVILIVETHEGSQWVGGGRWGRAITSNLLLRKSGMKGNGLTDWCFPLCCMFRCSVPVSLTTDVTTSIYVYGVCIAPNVSSASKTIVFFCSSAEANSCQQKVHVWLILCGFVVAVICFLTLPTLTCSRSLDGWRAKLIHRWDWYGLPCMA